MVDSAVLPQLGTHFLHLVDQLLRLALELLNLPVLGLVDFLDPLGLELQFFVLDLKLVEGLSFLAVFFIIRCCVFYPPLQLLGLHILGTQNLLVIEPHFVGIGLYEFILLDKRVDLPQRVLVLAGQLYLKAP